MLTRLPFNGGPLALWFLTIILYSHSDNFSSQVALLYLSLILTFNKSLVLIFTWWYCFLFYRKEKKTKQKRLELNFAHLANTSIHLSNSSLKYAAFFLATITGYYCWKQTPYLCTVENKHHLLTSGAAAKPGKCSFSCISSFHLPTESFLSA